jgi:hypothetical protein
MRPFASYVKVAFAGLATRPLELNLAKINLFRLSYAKESLPRTLPPSRAIKYVFVLVVHPFSGATSSVFFLQDNIKREVTNKNKSDFIEMFRLNLKGLTKHLTVLLAHLLPFFVIVLN